MYKAILVEDEIAIRENIADNFPWAENQLIYAGEASDGESALQLIEDVNPNIIITDIKMPFLNGLELSKIIRRQMPWIKIIIMTGYDEFELAQQAIKLGVSDYLLKPVGLRDLQASIQTVIKTIQEDEQNLQNIEKLQSEMEINKNYLQNEFLRNVLAGALSYAQIYETAASLNIQLKGKLFAVILLRLDLGNNSERELSKELIKAGSIIYSLQTYDILLVRHSLKEYVLIVKGNESANLQNDCYRISQSVKAELEAKTNVRLSVFIGGIKTRIQEIHQSYQEAMQISNLTYLFGDNKIISLEDIKMVNPYHGTLIPFERRELAQFLRSGFLEEIDRFIDQHKKRFENFPKTLFHLMLVRFNLYYEIALFFDEIGFYSNELGNNRELNALAVDFSKEFSEKQIIEQAHHALEYAIGQRERRKIQKYDLLIQKAKDFIQANYQKSSLQLSDVAMHLNISTSHLSTIFNQESGTSYTEYVTNVRIQKAKELLLGTNLNSSEIAFKVGYNDPHYFYNIFKKVTGMTSSAFRSQKVEE